LKAHASLADYVYVRVHVAGEPRALAVCAEAISLVLAHLDAISTVPLGLTLVLQVLALALVQLLLTSPSP